MEVKNTVEPQPDTLGISGLLHSVINAGRDILARRRKATTDSPSSDLIDKCKQLLHHRGEASGLALACEVIDEYRALDDPNKLAFFDALSEQFSVDSEAVIAAAQQYQTSTSSEHLSELSRAIEAPRLKLFRRMNMAPDATPTLVKMRGEVLRLCKTHPHLKVVESDLKQLFISWFNRGFLQLSVIDWQSPAAVLERIIRYESVHAIKGWDDLRSRLSDNRMCFAFFHPTMPDDPLVFVEVAITAGTPAAIAPIIEKTNEPDDVSELDTAVFYSISNCHPGLAGVSFGNFLIKQVVKEVGKRFPLIKRFITLSPVPGFAKWLTAEKGEAMVEDLRALAASEGRETHDRRWESAVAVCAHYLVNERQNDLAADPVARFHLGNGASLHAIHWAADLSERGLKQSAGIMVNYLYDLENIEENHDAYFDEGRVARSKTVNRLL